MAGTMKTKETFESDVRKKDLDKEVALRIKAGAIKSSYKKNSDGTWTLTTTWNVIGQQ